MSDYIDREYLVEHIHACMENDRLMLTATKEEILQMVADVSTAEPPWVPIKWHYITDEEREREGYPKDWVIHIDCEMPCDEQEILVQTKKGYIRWDVCYEDGEFSLDSGWDWVEDIVAWMPLPDPWKGGAE